MSDLSDMYARYPRATSLRDEGTHIRQVMSTRATNIITGMYVPS